MAALPTLNAASPLNADDANRLLFTIDTTEVLSRALDNTPSDFATMNSLSWTVQERENITGGDDSLVLGIRIMDGATVLAASSAGGAYQTVITHASGGFHTTDTNRGPTAFSFVDQVQGKSVWDNAIVELQQTYTKAKGADGVRFEIDIVSFTGDYDIAAGAPPERLKMGVGT